MSTQPQKRCLLLSPRGVDTSLLRAELSDRGITLLNEADILIESARLGRLAEAIAAVDFVCGVIPDGPPNPNVLFELGIAVGTNRPVLVFVSQDAEVPLALRGRLSTHALTDSGEALRFHLDLFLKQGGNQVDRHRADSSPEPNLPNPGAMKPALAQVARWEQANHAPTERELVTLLAGVFESAGLLYAPETSIQGAEHIMRRADLGVWIDDLDAVQSNPLLIEVCGISQDRRDRAAQFRTYLAQSGLPLGLLVRWAPSRIPSVPVNGRGPMVVEMSVREVIEAIGQGELARVLLTRGILASPSAA